MNRFLLILATTAVVGLVLAYAPQADAAGGAVIVRRGFQPFPVLSAIVANRQARFANAQANLFNAQANALAAQANLKAVAFSRNRVVFVGSPVIYAPPVHVQSFPVHSFPAIYATPHIQAFPAYSFPVSPFPVQAGHSAFYVGF